MADFGKFQMSDQQSFLSADNFYSDPYSRYQTAERMLNTAITRAESSGSFEEYLEIFDEFYADDVEVCGETREEPIRGKARVCSVLLSFLLVPLHVWPKSAVSRYAFERARSPEMLQARRIPHGGSIWSGCPIKPVL
jgi:hypothetical protein